MFGYLLIDSFIYCMCVFKKRDKKLSAVKN